jgi:glycosyltransferase involved in cell wall biosynthesis
MLHPGALSQKSFKKKVFLSIFKMLGLQKKCEFHATTTGEEGFIKDVFGKDVKVWVAPNLPKVLGSETPIHKKVGELSLVTVALISPMKNIKLVLEALQNCKSNISYNIYGPVKDEIYWNECKNIINVMPSNVRVQYHGAIEPYKVETVLQKHHSFIMPSKSENFGHAIFEALSVGKPVITSQFTPWNELEKYKAGYNIDVNDIATITSAIEQIACMDNDTYTQWSEHTTKYSAKKINMPAIISDYKAMFKFAS